VLVVSRRQWFTEQQQQAADDYWPNAGDIVEGTTPDGREIFGRVERTDGLALAVRDDAGTLWDFFDQARRALRIIERWGGRTFTAFGWTYAPTISRLGPPRRGVYVRNS
jgi:hypothetical protein